MLQRPAQEVQDEVCREGKPSDTILLLPEQYTFFPRGAAWASRCRLFEPDFRGGVTFGAWLPDSGVCAPLGRVGLPPHEGCSAEGGGSS